LPLTLLGARLRNRQRQRKEVNQKKKTEEYEKRKKRKKVRRQGKEKETKTFIQRGRKAKMLLTLERGGPRNVDETSAYVIKC